MNAFKVFATMSLVDAISKPLALIRSSMKNTEGAAGTLSNRLGRLATSFGKVAAPCAAFLGLLGMMTSEAIAFESKMADVAKVIDFESPAELREMSLALQDLSLQIPIAAEGFADITAAAAQSGVGKKDLIEFGVQAAKMGVAFDVAAGDASKTMADWRAAMGLTLMETYSLADAVNYLSNNMNATATDISQVLNRMGAVGKAAGFTETQLAALAASGLSAGASTDIVGTGLNSIFATMTQGSSMMADAAKAFKTLGFEAESLAKSMQMDAQGTIMQVLESIAALPKENQLSVITAAFGQLSLKSIAPMVGNIDNLRQAFNLVGDAANYAGSMEAEYAARSATTENSIQLLKNSFNVLCITVGELFTPIINAAAKALAAFSSFLIELGRSEAGSFIIKLAAGIAAALVGTTALITAFAILKPIILIVVGALGSVLWPVLLIAGAVALLALAWKNDLGGIATTVTNFYNKVKLVFSAVREIFSSLVDGKGKMSAEMAKEIEAQGLTGIVTTVSRVLVRVKAVFSGIAEGAKSMLGPALGVLENAFIFLKDSIGEVIGKLTPVAGLFGKAAGSTKISVWRQVGKVIGTVVTAGITAVVYVLSGLVAWFAAGVKGVSQLISVFADFGKILVDVAAKAWDFAVNVKDSIAGFAQNTRQAITNVITMISQFSLADAGRALLQTFIDGVKSMASSLLDTVSNLLSRVREYLPFSDAKVGPLSNLSASGMAFISTIKDGIMARAGELLNTVKDLFGRVAKYFSFGSEEISPPPVAAPIMRPTPLPTYGSDFSAPNKYKSDGLAPDMYRGFNLPQKSPVNFMPDNGVKLKQTPFDFSPAQTKNSAAKGKKETNARSVTIHIGNIELPNVNDSDSFIKALEELTESRAY